MTNPRFSNAKPVKYQKTYTWSHHIQTTEKSKREKILKEARGGKKKPHWFTNRGIRMKITSDFSSDIMQTRERKDIFKVLKKRKKEKVFKEKKRQLT